MINIAIVEDEDYFASIITKYLEQYAQERCEEIHHVRFSDGYAIADGYKGGYDIILMDIEMGLMNGMEAAEAIRKVDDEVTIIFITNMAQYAIKGYAVHALDYVLKPVSYPAFAESLKKAISRIDGRKKRFITINNREGMVKLFASDITFVESHGHRLTFHTQDHAYESTAYTMKETETKLQDCGFLRSSSGVLVNLNRVTGVKNGYVEVGGQSLPISRSRKNEFMAELVRKMVE